MIIFKSKLYREEIKHWALIVTLIAWASLATLLALRNNNKVILIGVDESGMRLVTDSKDILVQPELRQFVQTFVNNYYTYEKSNFSERVGAAADLMTQELWEREKSKVLGIKQKLENFPLSQDSELISMDLIEKNLVEAIVNIRIKSRLSSQVVKLKLTLKLSRTERSEQNPWSYEIMELSDATL